MAVFSKGNLYYNDYKWTAYPSDDPKVTGKPDSTLLNKSEGYEMVYFINRYMESQNWKTESTGQKIEKYIRDSKSVHQSHAFWTKDLNTNFIL